MNAAASLRRRALRLEQAEGHPLFLFALRADEIFQIAEVSRISRDEAGDLLGYQRDVVRRHVQGILEYLDQSETYVPFPHALVLALPSSTQFFRVRGPKVSEEALGEAGTLEIPLPKPGAPRPAWIIDGQQRALALAQCKHPGLPIPVCGLVADDVTLQRDQFIRINNMRALSKSLINELLPEVDTLLPPHLSARKAPAALCDILNRDPKSPFFGLIRRASGKEAKDRGVVTDTALIKVIEESLNQPGGCLFPYRNLGSGESDFGRITRVLYIFWNAVKETWPEAWGLPPTKSRLLHSAGLTAMGKLMDRVMGTVDVDDTASVARVRKDLECLRPTCHWTTGAWEEIENLQWNQIQNLPGHVRMLSSVLIRAHLASRREGL